MRIPKNLISQRELARQFDVSEATVLWWRKYEGLPFFRAGSRVFIDREEAEVWYRDHRLLKPGTFEPAVKKTA